MKILQIHNHYKCHGGEDEVFTAERAMLKQYGHKVISYECINAKIDKYSFFKKINIYFNMHWSEDNYLKIKKFIRKEKPDIAHIHNTFLLITPSVYYACKELNVPIVQTLHNYRFLCPGANFYRSGHICEECLKRKNFRKGILNGCWRNSKLLTAAVARMLRFHYKKGTFKNLIDCYITLSKFSRNKFIEAGFDAEKIAVKPNFVYPDSGTEEGSKQYMLFVGRLSPEKGIQTLLRAWQDLKRIPLKIVGSGPLKDKIETLIRKSNLRNVELLGYQSHNETMSLIKKARCLIFPSEWYECFPVTIIEAFACGIPVVASHLGAMKEIVHHEKTGLHFIPGDSKDLRSKIKWVLKNPKKMEEIGKQAKKEYEQKYTAEKNYGILINIYKKTIKNSKKLTG